MKYLEHLSLVASLVPNPLPLDIPKGLTTMEILAEMESKINKIIDLYNNQNSYADSLDTKIREELQALKLEVKNYFKNFTLNNGEVKLNNLDIEVLNYINNNKINNTVKSGLYRIEIDNNCNLYLIKPDGDKYNFICTQDGNLYIEGED